MKPLPAAILSAAVLLSLSGCADLSRAPEPEQQPSAYTEAPLPEATTSPAEPSPAESTAPPAAPVAGDAEEVFPPPQPEPEDDTLVRVSDYIPGIRESLFYATEENFTGQTIYDFSDAFLRYGTVKKLAAVSAELAERDLALMIWDGFRPVSAQYKLWEICPDPAYVANPTKGYSSHSRGNTVDLTLVDAGGNPLEMPTGFDDFSALADRDYSDCTPEAAENALLLENLMEKHGFSGYWGEWWHYSDTDTYPVPEDFSPIPTARYYADCQEFISLRTRPDTSAQVITRITVGEEFDVLAFQGEFALARYQGMQGYVLRSYIHPAI